MAADVTFPWKQSCNQSISLPSYMQEKSRTEKANPPRDGDAKSWAPSRVARPPKFIFASAVAVKLFTPKEVRAHKVTCFLPDFISSMNSKEKKYAQQNVLGSFFSARNFGRSR